MRRTVMLVSPTAAPGGAERALALLARRLPAFGYDAAAVLLEDGPLCSWLDGCRVEVVPAGRTRRLPTTLRVVRRLAQLAAGADVVVSNLSKGHVYGGMAARRARVPEVWWQHAVPSPRRLLDRVAAAVPTAAVVCTGEAARAAQARLTPSRRIEVIHPGVPVEEIARRAGEGRHLRERLGWQGHLLVGTVARLDPWKGHDVFLRAAARVAAEHPGARFVVVGGAVLAWQGDQLTRLRKITAELGLSERVHFTGHVDDVVPWIDALDVVASASRGETFGLSLVEAMALGKPVVATDCGGPSEIVDDGVTGLLVPVDDHEALAAALSHLLADPQRRAELGSRARARATLFREDRMVETMASLLDDLR